MTREKAAQICQAINFILDKEDYSEEVEEALDMAIKALEQEPICCINCIHCKVMGEVTRYSYCDMWDSVVDPYGYCNYGERKE